MAATPLHDQVLRLLAARRVVEADAAVSMALQAGGGPEAYRAAAQVAFAAGDGAGALAWLDRAVELGDAAGIARLERAHLLVAVGAPEQAMDALHDLVSDVPSYDAAFFLGRLLYEARREDEAVAAFRRALAARPDEPAAQRALAESLFAAERYEDALAMFEALAARSPGDPALVMRCVRCEARSGDVPGALARLDAATRRFPGHAELALLEGQLAEDAGDRDRAMLGYSRARGLSPGWAEPVAAQLLLTHRQPEPELRQRAEQLVSTPSVAGAEKAFLHYALGKAEAAAGHHATAWSHWTRANAIRRSQSPAEAPDALQRRIDVIRGTYTRELTDAWAARAPSDERPVLVVGMPRSGTTLVEQVLAAHPEARGAGESPVLAQLHIEMLAARERDTGGPTDAASMAARYMDVLVKRAGGDGRRLVDKQPYNFLFLGLAAALLPAARVVWCRRDPRDVAVSIYGESFAPQARYATDLAETRELIAAQDALMSHWQSVLQLPILELRYEDLVGDFETQARRLVEFSGLRWDDACLDFHASTGPVQTNSRWQVRQPVNRSAIGRWRHYRDALAAAGFDVR